MTPTSHPTMISTTLAVAWKDLRIELRSRETVNAMALFALLAVLLFSFALDLDRTGREASAAGVLWVTLVFAGTLGLGRSLGREKDEGTLDGLLLAPSDRSALYFGKLIGSFLFMAVVALLLIPILAVLFDTPFINPLISGVVLLGILSYAGVGVLVASLAAYTRGRELLLPVLLLPIALSILIPAVQATRGLLEGRSPGEVTTWVTMLAAGGVIYIVLAYLFFDYVVEE